MNDVIWYSRLAVWVGAGALLLQAITGRSAGFLTLLAVIAISAGLVTFLAGLALASGEDAEDFPYGGPSKP